MKTKKLLSALGAAAGFAFASAPASAVTFYSPITVFEDDNLDFIVDNNSDGLIGVGDRIISVGEVRQSAGIMAGQGPTPIGTPELTFVADVTVVAAIGSTFILGPSGAAGVLAAFAAGTTVAAFTDATPDFEPINATCGTRAACLITAGLGLADGSVLFATFGFFGDANEAWIFSVDPVFGSVSIAAIQGAAATTKAGTVNFFQSIGVDATGANLQPQLIPGCVVGPTDCMIDAIGSADFLGGQGLTAAEWNARTDADFQVAVPEPGSLALLALALLGLGGFRLRRHLAK